MYYKKLTPYNWAHGLRGHSTVVPAATITFSRNRYFGPLKRDKDMFSQPFGLCYVLFGDRPAEPQKGHTTRNYGVLRSSPLWLRGGEQNLEIPMLYILLHKS
jgi:hypothetical protein